MRFLEGWPVPRNMIPDGLCQDVGSLMKVRRARCEVSGRIASYLVSLIKDWIARCQVSGRIASSRKYGPGWPEPGYGQFVKDWNAICKVSGNIVLGGVGQDMVSLIKD